MGPIYDPMVFITYLVFLALCGMGAVIFFWIVIGSERFPVGLVYGHIGLAAITLVLFTATIWGIR